MQNSDKRVDDVPHLLMSSNEQHLSNPFLLDYPYLILSGRAETASGLPSEPEKFLLHSQWDQSEIKTRPGHPRSSVRFVRLCAMQRDTAA